jgi:uncharacterized protein YbjT (DUF2867 family)
VTLVFGAAGGIGSALARRLHALSQQQGGGGATQHAPAAIVLSDEREGALQQLAQQLPGVDVVAADARDPAAVRAGVAGLAGAPLFSPPPRGRGLGGRGHTVAPVAAHHW